MASISEKYIWNHNFKLHTIILKYYGFRKYRRYFLYAVLIWVSVILFHLFLALFDTNTFVSDSITTILKCLIQYTVSYCSRNLAQLFYRHCICLISGIKDYSNWPTIPQIYINGEFVGGCDIMIELHQKGDLVEELKKAGIMSALSGTSKQL